MAATAAVVAGGQRAGVDSGTLFPLDAALTCTVLLVLNLLDALFTLSYLELGLAREANPLMRALYEHSPLAFLVGKLCLVHGGLYLLWRLREANAARVALHLGLAVYTGIVAYHLSFLVRLHG